MKKMEKTAGEKPGKDDAIRKDNEASAEKIDIKTDAAKEKSLKDTNPNSSSSIKNEKEIKKIEPLPDPKNKEINDSQPTESEKGSGLRSSAEGQNSNSPLPTDDDGIIVL